MEISIMIENQHMRTSSIPLVDSFDDVIYRLHLIKIKIEVAIQNRKTKQLQEHQQLKLNSLWNKYHTVVTQFLLQFEQTLKNIKEFRNTEIKGEDITYLLKYLDLPIQNSNKTHLSKSLQPLSLYPNCQKDTNIIRKCNKFISDQDQDELKVQIPTFIKSRTLQKLKNQVQTVQKQVQTNPLTINQNNNFSSSNPHTSQTIPIFKSKVFSTYQTPSPFGSHNESQHFSSSPLKKGDKPSLPSTDRQKHSKLSNHQNVSLITLDTLLYVLKMMEYLLPVGFLVGQIQNIKICRSYMGENRFLQQNQADWVGKILHKLVKKMKIFKKQLKKDYLTSKFIDFSQKISIKVN